MATLFKPTYTIPLPADAKIVTRDEKQFARFKRKGQTTNACGFQRQAGAVRK